MLVYQRVPGSCFEDPVAAMHDAAKSKFISPDWSGQHEQKTTWGLRRWLVVVSYFSSSLIFIDGRWANIPNQLLKHFSKWRVYLHELLKNSGIPMAVSNSYETQLNRHLVGGLFFIIFFHILGIVIPTDELIFFRGVGKPPTSIYIYIHTVYTILTVIFFKGVGIPP